MVFSDFKYLFCFSFYFCEGVLNDLSMIIVIAVRNVYDKNVISIVIS